MISGISYLKDCLGILPFLIMFGMGIVILLVGAFAKSSHKVKASHIAISSIIMAIFSLFYPFKKQIIFSGMVYWDKFSLFLEALFLISSLVVVLLSIGTMKKDDAEIPEYYALILFATSGMILISQAAHLIVLFLALEIFSISIYILAGLPKHKASCVESSLKYFILGAFGSAFLIYGLTFIYGGCGSLSLNEIAKSLSKGAFSNTYLILGACLVLVGLGFKIALVPFHMWTPDVYEGAPTTITAFMAVGVKAAAFAAFVRVFWFGLNGINIEWNTLFWILAVLTMSVGNVCALRQESIKRMLAYSSIAHAGYIFIALVVGDKTALASMLYYLISYAFMNLGAFGVLILVKLFDQKETYEDFKGFVYSHPFLGVCMTIFMCSLMGMPPTAGFLAKFFVFSSAVKAGYIWLVVLAVLNSIIAAYYYLRVIIYMFTRDSLELVQNKVSLGYGAVALLISVIGTLGLGILPNSFWEIARQSISLL